MPVNMNMKPWRCGLTTTVTQRQVTTVTTTDPGRGVVANSVYANEDDKPSPPAGPSPQQIALDKAKAARSDALKKKQKELKDAFGFFNEDFYNDMGQSYKDFAQGSLDTAYDDHCVAFIRASKQKVC